ncbi:MAG: esterase [Hyphomicrobiales bacterium]|nr:esterase [Hyphomicrobiales bacterium]
MSKVLATRRAALAALAAASAAAGMTPARAQTAARKTFLFVHGAYHGGWCWQRVVAILERQGHKVYAPSLTGNGDRVHLLSKDLTLDTQIADIVNLAKWEDMKNICLVAHSFGGWQASGALEQIADRVDSLVLVDAFKPKDGEKPLDYISDFSRKALEEAMARGEAGRKPAAASVFSNDEKSYAWIESKLTPQPNNITFQPVKLTGKLETVAKKTYIRAPKYAQPAFDRALAECRANASWQTFVNETTGHDIMIDQPEWLADLILKVS